MGSGPDHQGLGPSSTISCLGFLNFKRGGGNEVTTGIKLL